MKYILIFLGLLAVWLFLGIMWWVILPGYMKYRSIAPMNSKEKRRRRWWQWLRKWWPW